MMRPDRDNISDLARVLDDFVATGELTRQSADNMLRRVERGIRIMEREFTSFHETGYERARESRQKHRGYAVSTAE